MGDDDIESPDGVALEIKELLDSYPAISSAPECTVYDQVRRINAQLTYFMRIADPEKLDDDIWIEKYRQFQWLLENNYLPITIKKNE